MRNLTKRGLSLFLAFVLVIGLFPYTSAVATTSTPSGLNVNFDYGDDYLGEYTSTNLNSSVNVRSIPISYTYDGATKESYGLCLDHGASLANGSGYTYGAELTSYAAAPFIAWLIVCDEVYGYSDAGLQAVQGWVNAAVWLTEAGVLTDPTNAAQIEMLVNERKELSIGLGWATEESYDEIAVLAELNLIVSNYNSGAYGTFTFHQFNPTSSSNQSILVAVREADPDNYPVYVQLKKSDENGNELGGATFEIFDGSTWKASIVTDSSGYGVSSEIRISAETATLTVVETSAPTGYTSSTQTYTVSVDSTINGTASTAAWVNNGSAITNSKIEIPTEYIILKTDAATGEPLSGATFRLDEAERSLTYDLVTNEDGVIELQWSDSSEDNYITPGTYTVTETSPPAGYSLSDASVETLTFELIWNNDTNQWEQNSPGQLIYENPKDNTIRFTKIDSDGNVLDGGTFNVYKDGTLLGQYEGGTIILSDLKTGYYVFEEVAAPSGYVASSNPYASIYADVTDTATDTYYLSMINYTYPDIQIRKSDPTGLGLANAIFDVQIDGTPIGQVTTNSIGVATITYDQYGEFLSSANDSWTLTVTEVQAPEGFLMSDTNVITAEIQKGQALATLEFVNDPIPEIQIAKIDSATGLPLAGAEFAVYIDGVQIGSYYSDEDGIVSLNYSDYGNHLDLTANSWVIKVIETAAPANYDLSTVTEQELTVVRGQTVAAFTFGNYEYAQIEIYKVDEDTNEPLSGSLFKVSIDTQVLGYFTTGSDGKVVISYADYYEFLGVTTDDEWVIEVEEIRAPSGFLLNANNIQSAVLNRNQGLITFSFQNEIYPEVHIYKTDSNGNALANTLFSVSVDGTEFGQFWTNNSGEIIITHDTYGDFLGDSGADSWTVTVTEVQPTTGYLLSGTITATQEVKRGQAVAEFTFANYEVPEIQILKTDSSTGEPLANAEFSVSIDGQSIGNFLTDENGLILLGEANYGTTFDLAAGSWLFTVTEVNPPSGYALNYETTQSVTVTAGQTTVPFNFSNYLYPEIIITKADADTNDALAGAIFEVSVDAQTFGTFTTGEDGTVTITYADYYEYLTRDADSWTVTVEELSAPSGFLLNANNTQTAELSRNQGLLTFAYSNYAAPTIQIEKLDSTNGNNPVSGAVFEVRLDTASLGSFVTDENGLITITYNEYGAFLDQSKSSWTVTATELSSPDGYLMSDITTLSNEMVLGQKLCSFVFTNALYPSIIVEKRSSVTNELLAGATFDVTIDATHIGSWTTDENGQFTIAYDQYGGFIGNDTNDSWTVYVTETQAPDGYHNAEIDTQQAQMFYGQDLTPFVFVNIPRSDLLITKVDSVDESPLEGVTFNVMRDTVSIGTFKTDSSGNILIEDLEVGTYTVTEVDTIYGYVLNDTPQTVEVTMDDNIFLYTLDFENDRQPTLTVNKIDSITGDPILGALFSVTYQSSKTTTGEIRDLGTYYTDTNGQFELLALDEGWYTVTELEPADGYSLKEPLTQELHLSGNENATMTFENIPLSALVIKKVDATTGEVLQGAKFSVSYLAGTSGTGGTVIGTYETSVNGTIVITGLAAGTYIIQETQAPSGYIIDDAPETVYISGEAQDVVMVEFENQPDSGLIITKLDSETNLPLAGATFQITTDDGTVVGNSNGQYTTDESGYIHIPNLATDTYVVTEVSSPTGYVLDTTPQTVKLIYGETHSLTFYNDPDPIGSLTITKLDSSTGEPLAGAVFKITTSDGAVVGNSNGTYTTDSSGTILLTDLAAGTYIVTEVTAPSGYELDATPQTIVITHDTVHSLTFYNAPHGGLVIQKLDSVTGEALSGAVFKVTTSDGTYVANYGGTVSSNGLYTTNAYGQIHIVDLEPDTYIVTEVESPDGYILDSTPQTVRVYENDTQTLTFENTPLGGLRIIKVDSDDGSRIKGVQFEISKMNGERLGTYTTDQNGLIQLSGIDSGWYTIVETKSAEGYILDTSPYSLEVKDGGIAVLTVENTLESAFLIHKVDSVTGDGIYGVQFLLSDSKNNPIGTYVSDQNGYVYITDDLTDGKYYIRELVAADGYLLDSTVRTFYVEYGSTSMIEWENTPVMGQIQITKLSADDNLINGLPAGTALPDATFAIYNYEGQLVETIVSGDDGRAISSPLPLGRYTVKEISAPMYYNITDEVMDVSLDYAGQIVRFNVLNESTLAYVGVEKTGYATVMAGQLTEYEISNVNNYSNVALDNFYIRDTLPTEGVRLNQITTGTWNQFTTYKVLYQTNLNDFRTLVDNLSSQQSYVIDASSAALNLASNEYVTQIIFQFGTVQSGFTQTSAMTLACTVNSWVINGDTFSNQVDVGGLWGSQWVTATDRWVTTVYGIPVSLPKTGY